MKYLQVKSQDVWNLLSNHQHNNHKQGVERSMEEQRWRLQLGDGKGVSILLFTLFSMPGMSLDSFKEGVRWEDVRNGHPFPLQDWKK